MTYLHVSRQSTLAEKARIQDELPSAIKPPFISIFSLTLSTTPSKMIIASLSDIFIATKS